VQAEHGRLAPRAVGFGPYDGHGLTQGDVVPRLEPRTPGNSESPATAFAGLEDGAGPPWDEPRSTSPDRHDAPPRAGPARRSASRCVPAAFGGMRPDPGPRSNPRRRTSARGARALTRAPPMPAVPGASVAGLRESATPALSAGFFVGSCTEPRGA